MTMGSTNRVYETRAQTKNYNKEEMKRKKRKRTMKAWHVECDAAPPGWGGGARNLIPCLEKWIAWEPRVLNFHVTQMLTAHGCFRAYLKARIDRDPSPMCEHYVGQENTQLRALFVCERWMQERAELHIKSGILNTAYSTRHTQHGILKSVCTQHGKFHRETRRDRDGQNSYQEVRPHNNEQEGGIKKRQRENVAEELS